MMRGLVILFVLAFVVGNAGTVLCETDCAGAKLSQDARALPSTDGGANTMHCHDIAKQTARNDAPVPHGNSHRNPKDCGAHQHARILATVSSGAQIALARAVATPGAFFGGAPRSVDVPGVSRNENASVAINPHLVIASGVLRI